MKIEFGKTHFFVFTSILFLLLGGYFVYAYGTSNPQVFGHSLGEIEGFPTCSAGQALTKTVSGWSCVGVGGGSGSSNDFDNYVLKTSPGAFTWTVPAGVNRIKVQMVGGGGAGCRSGSSNLIYYSSGGGAGYVEGFLDVVSNTILNGFVGSGGISSGTNYNPGSASNFAGAFIANGGGAVSACGTSFAAGGTSSGPSGSLALFGQQGSSECLGSNCARDADSNDFSSGLPGATILSHPSYSSKYYGQGGEYVDTSSNSPSGLGGYVLISY